MDRVLPVPVLVALRMHPGPGFGEVAMEFWKGHALGNDYIVVDGSGLRSPEPELIRALCDRHRGIGGDGVLWGDPGADPPGLRIFNPDGSEAEKSGNGLRIFGAWLHQRSGRAEGPFRVALPGETVEMEVVAGSDAGVGAGVIIRVEMGRASYRAGDVGYSTVAPDAEVQGAPVRVLDEELAIHLVSMGNPHCVVFEDTLDDDRFRRLAPLLQADPAFARGVNVQFARVAGPTTLEARIWERGAGETLASGSSACAVAAAALRAGRVDAPTLVVRMPGGEVEVQIEEDWRVMLTGPAEIIFRGDIEIEDR